jgi:putative membrane protein
MNLSIFPLLNASLNAATGVLIILGFVLIKRKAQTAHAITMLLAMFTSTLFLVSYLYYHFHHGTTQFPHQGWIRPTYFSVLISHMVLAVMVPPLAIVTLVHAVKHQFAKHVKLARILFPIWLYVSVTGVLIYWMLYRMKPDIIP